jgi:hypothetical protein
MAVPGAGAEAVSAIAPVFGPELDKRCRLLTAVREFRVAAGEPIFRYRKCFSATRQHWFHVAWSRCCVRDLITRVGVTEMSGLTAWVSELCTDTCTRNNGDRGSCRHRKVVSFR